MMPPLSDHLLKIRDPSAAILARFQLSEKASTMVDPTQPPGQILAVLIGAGCLADALRVLAFGLPKRESVWWACVCTRSTLPVPPAPLEAKVLEMAELWVLHRKEEDRRAAMAAAEAAGFTSAGSWCGVGAFWAEGSMAPASAPALPAGPTLTSQAVAGAVQLASLRPDPAAASARLQDFIAWGMDIAAGGRGR